MCVVLINPSMASNKRLGLGFIGYQLHSNNWDSMVQKLTRHFWILKTGRTLVYVLVYGDDILVTGNNNLGKLNYFLGIEIILKVTA